MFLLYPLRPSEPSTAGLVGYWPLDGNALDTSGNGNNGTIVGGATAVAGKVNTALDFNGTSGVVTTSGGIINTANDFTMSAWVYVDAVTGTDNIVAAYNTNPTYQAALLNLNSTILAASIVNTANGDFCSGNVSYSAGQWYHLAFTKTSSNCSFYLNGVKEVNDTTLTGTPLASNVFRIGARNWGAADADFFDGKIDDVRIYNRALSADEIKQYYDATSGGHYTAGSPARPNSAASVNSTLTNGLVGQWTFDGPDTTSTTATDKSGSGNNGTLTNMTFSQAQTPGVFGQGLKFDGVNDYVDVGTGALTTGATTLAYWYKYNGSGNTFTSDLKIMQANGIFSISGATSYIAIRGAGISPNTSSSLTSNTWHHVAFVYNGNGAGTLGNYKIYEDGVDTAISAGAGNGVGWTTNVLGNVNGGGSTSAFNGSLDDVRVYNRALSAGEVQQLYNLGR